jgi:hypothetical protein
VVSEGCLLQAEYQMDGIEKIAPVKGSELIGLKCVAPLVHREILTLPATSWTRGRNRAGDVRSLGFPR